MKLKNSDCLRIRLFALIVLAGMAGVMKIILQNPRVISGLIFRRKNIPPTTATCNYSFEYPVYAIITPFKGAGAEPCWINIEFPGYKGKIHLTYKALNNDLAKYVEDIHTLAYKHIIKADDIIEKPVSFPDRKVYGLIYDIRGNTASSMSFYLTDSSRNFLSGALYFSVIPNKDSLAPVIRFFTQDINHLIETLNWNNQK